MPRINWGLIDRKLGAWEADQLVFCWYVPEAEEVDNAPWKPKLPVEDQYAIIQEEVDKQVKGVDWEKVWGAYTKWCYWKPHDSQVDSFTKIKQLVRRHRISS